MTYHPPFFLKVVKKKVYAPYGVWGEEVVWVFYIYTLHKITRYIKYI